MNTTVIQKCLTELQKDKPDLSYIRGMLETLQDLALPQYAQEANITYSSFPAKNVQRTETIADEDQGDPDATTRYLSGGPIAPLGES